MKEVFVIRRGLLGGFVSRRGARTAYLKYARKFKTRGAAEAVAQGNQRVVPAITNPPMPMWFSTVCSGRETY